MSYSNPAAYQRFMGRWSARLAPAFVRFAGLRDGQQIMDVGCGTGSLSRALVSLAPHIIVTGLDPAPSYVAYARDAVVDARVQFQTGVAETLPFSDKTFDAALALLVVQDFSDAGRAVSEMARVTRRNGPVAACQWDFEAGLPMLSLLWQAAEAVAPEAVSQHRRATSGSCGATLQDLENLWRSCGLSQIESAVLELPMYFLSFDDYWQPFLGKSTPTSAFATEIDARTRGALARVLRERMPGVQLDGSFVLPARASAIKGMA